MEEWFFQDNPEMCVWMQIFGYVCKRGRVGTSNGITFFIHTAENGHNKPHLHACYQQKEIVLEIPSGKVLAGDLDAKRKKQASNWVIEHQDFLKTKWDELAGGVCCFG